MHIFRILFALICILLGSTFLWANTSTFSTTLSNGLKVIIKEDHRSPMVMTQIWYGVGSIDEPIQHAGISHLLEHMMFKGTVKVPDNEIKRINAEYGGQLNAFTSNSYTYYYQLYPKAYFPLALELEADRMSNLLLRQTHLTTETQVVKEERLQRVDDRPQSFAFEQFKFKAYPTSTYRQPVIGFPSSLDQIELSDLQAWYNTWYAPNNATIVIVGDVKVEAALLQVQRFFGDIQRKNLPTNNLVLEATNQGYRHADLYQDIQVENLYMAWNVPSLKTAKNATDAYTLMLLKNILSGTISSRLESKLIRERNILSSVSVNYDMIQRGDTLFTITAIPSLNVSLQEAHQAIIEEINLLESTPITADELARIRTNMWAKHIFAQDSLQGQAYVLGVYAVNGYDEKKFSTLSTEYKKISPFDIQRVLKTYFHTENLTTLYLNSLQQQVIEQITAEPDPQAHTTDQQED